MFNTITQFGFVLISELSLLDLHTLFPVQFKIDRMTEVAQLKKEMGGGCFPRTSTTIFFHIGEKPSGAPKPKKFFKSRAENSENKVKTSKYKISGTIFI